MRTVYLAHAATTPAHPKVVEAMMPYFTSKFGNPSNLHDLGREAKNAVEEARAKTAALIGAKPEEVFLHLERHGVQQFRRQGAGAGEQPEGQSPHRFPG